MRILLFRESDLGSTCFDMSDEPIQAVTGDTSIRVSSVLDNAEDFAACEHLHFCYMLLQQKNQIVGHSLSNMVKDTIDAGDVDVGHQGTPTLICTINLQNLNLALVLPLCCPHRPPVVLQRELQEEPVLNMV